MDQNKAQLKVKVRPGKASTLSIAHPAGACERGMEIENGSCPTLAVLIRDAAGNSTFDFKGAEIVSSVNVLCAIQYCTVLVCTSISVVL